MIQIKQIAPDYYEAITPGGAKSYIVQKDGRFRLGGKEFGSVEWARKAIERSIAANPRLDIAEPNQVSIEDISLLDVPAGWSVVVKGKHTRITIQKKNMGSMNQTLPPNTFHVVFGMGAPKIVQGLDNAKAEALTTFNGLINANVEVYSGADADGVFQIKERIMRLNEEQVRQLVMEEWFSLLGEAGERRIVRPGGTSTRPPRQDIKPAQFTRKVTGLGDIVATNRNLTPDSPFVAGSDAFNAIYNNGTAEELIRFKVKNKQNLDDDRMLSRLVSHVFNAGTFCIVPELFNTGELGVGEIIDIVNRPVPGAPGETAPLALIDFNGRRIINVGIAFLEKISRNKVDDYNAKFKMNQREAMAKAARPSMGGMRTVKYGAPR